jgi:hypothetical protein
MSAAQKINQRVETRDFIADRPFPGAIEIQGDVPGRLFQPVDVSKRGIGFITNRPIKPGLRIYIEFGGLRARVELAFCSGHLGIDGLYRCGIFSWDERVDFTAEFRRLGIITSDSNPASHAK